MKAQALLLLVLPLLLSFAAGGVFRKPAIVGGWQPIKDVKDPHVQELGQFAVNEHNKEARTDLKFQSVIKGETQVVAGTNYRLVIAAVDGDVANNYEAVVWERPWEHYKNLTSFKQMLKSN